MTINDEALDRREVFLSELMCDAAKLAQAGFARQADQAINLKGPQDFLTETDTLIETHLRTRIAESYPEDSFLGEEGGGEIGEHIWVVDPIDGTANFARSVPHFCISIAFIANRNVQLGAITNPMLDEMYAARLGRGATLNNRPINVSNITDIAASTFEIGWSNREPLEDYLGVVKALIEAGSNVKRSASGALGLAYVAAGRSDGYAELHMNSWDCLAGLLLVREAGGVTGPFLSEGRLTAGGPVLAAAPGFVQVLSEATGITLCAGLDILPQ